MDPVEEAAQVLMHDGIVIYPTDTVYGLGGDVFSDEAILKVYEAKRRPLSQPISIAVSSCDMIHGVAKVDECRCPVHRPFPPGADYRSDSCKEFRSRNTDWRDGVDRNSFSPPSACSAPDFTDRYPDYRDQCESFRCKRSCHS